MKIYRILHVPTNELIQFKYNSIDISNIANKIYNNISYYWNVEKYYILNSLLYNSDINKNLVCFNTEDANNLVSLLSNKTTFFCRENNTPIYVKIFDESEFEVIEEELDG